ncbi:hypothetical protein C0995_003656, partial [Termitomyces sp. Mi166
SSALLLTQEQPSIQVAPCNKGKGKAKVTEKDKDEEGEAAQKLRKELEDFVAAKAFLEQQGKLLQFFVLKSFKRKGKAKALGVDSELTGAKQTFKSTELVDSDSDEEEEEERVCIIKKIKRKHVEEPVGARKGKEIIELEDLEEETVVLKTLVAGPLHQTSKPVVLVPSMPKPIFKPILVPSTAQMVLSSAPKPAAAMPVSKPVPVKSAGKPAIKGSFLFKEPFMV